MPRATGGVTWSALPGAHAATSASATSDPSPPAWGHRPPLLGAHCPETARKLRRMVGVPSHSASGVRVACQSFTVFAYHPLVQPLLAASSLRLDVARVPAVDGLSLTSTGSRLLVLGAARALFESAAGLRACTRGELRVSGDLPLDALRGGTMAGAPLDPLMPPDWT